MPEVEAITSLSVESEPSPQRENRRAVTPAPRHEAEGRVGDRARSHRRLKYKPPTARPGAFCHSGAGRLAARLVLQAYSASGFDPRRLHQIKGYTAVLANACSPNAVKAANGRLQVSTLIDLTGKQFGLLRVVAIHPERVRHGKARKAISVLWLCVCDCGAERVVYGSNLRQGFTVSCGCRSREKTRSAAKNTATLSAATTPAFTTAGLACGNAAATRTAPPTTIMEVAVFRSANGGTPSTTFSPTWASRRPACRSSASTMMGRIALTIANGRRQRTSPQSAATQAQASALHPR